MKVLGRRHDSNLPDENRAALNGTELDRLEDTGKDIKEVGKSILVRLLNSTEEGNRTKLDNSGNIGNLKKKTHSATPERNRKEARRQNGVKGREEVWTKDGKSGTIKL
jgi:hypothetical protein